MITSWKDGLTLPAFFNSLLESYPASGGMSDKGIALLVNVLRGHPYPLWFSEDVRFAYNISFLPSGTGTDIDDF